VAFCDQKWRFFVTEVTAPGDSVDLFAVKYDGIFSCISVEINSVRSASYLESVLAKVVAIAVFQVWQFNVVDQG